MLGCVNITIVCWVLGWLLLISRVLGWLLLISLLYVAGVGVVSVNITIVCGGCWGGYC